MIYKFVAHEIRSLDEYKNSHPFRLHEALAQGRQPPTRIPACGYTKLMGWFYDYRPFLKKYWVKIKHYGVQEHWGWNKIGLRESLVAEYITPSHIQKIIEVK